MKEQDGEWAAVKETGKVIDKVAELRTILPQEGQDLLVEWSPKYEDLEPGTYRLTGEVLQAGALGTYRKVAVDFIFRLSNVIPFSPSPYTSI